MYQKIGKSQAIVNYDDDGMATNYEPVQEIVKIQKRHFKKGAFFMQTFDLESLILQKGYTITDLKVLFVLKGLLDFNNRIKRFRQVDIAKQIGSSQANVSRSINKLLADRIIIKDDLEYYFNDAYIKYAGNDKRKPKGNKNV